MPRCEIRLVRPSWWGGASYRFKRRGCGEWWSSSTWASHHSLVRRGSIHGGAEYPFRIFSALQGRREIWLMLRVWLSWSDTLVFNIQDEQPIRITIRDILGWVKAGDSGRRKPADMTTRKADTPPNRLYCESVIVASNTAARLPKRIASVQRAQPNAWPPAWTTFLQLGPALRASIGSWTTADIAATWFGEASHDPPFPSIAVLIGPVSACCGRTPGGPSSKWVRNHIPQYLVPWKSSWRFEALSSFELGAEAGRPTLEWITET